MTNVAIIIPVFYREHLKKAIRSVLLNDCDVILVNDSDVPLTYEHPRVTVIDNGMNLGVGISRNRGVRAALDVGYDLIGFVDSDSVLSPTWRRECEKTLQDPSIIGVSGLALNPNQPSTIARVKYVLKDYSRRKSIPFQIDCSLFKREAFAHASFGKRRIAEDAFFLRQIDRSRLAVNEDTISYHHEVDSVSDYFRKEIVGALYSLSEPLSVARSFFLTPYTCMKMVLRKDRHPDYPIAALIWLIRQVAWNLAYVLGRMADI